MVQRVWLFSKRFFAGSLVGLLCAVPAIAQRSSPGQQFIRFSVKPLCRTKSTIPEVLQIARVCAYGGTVTSSGEQFTQGSLGNKVLTPIVDIKTEARSASELYFNDRVVVRTLAGSLTFKEGLRLERLRHRPDLKIITRRQSVGVVVATKSLLLPGAYDVQVKRFAQEQTVFNETIFGLTEGTILAMIPPDAVLTEIQTSQSKIEVGAALSVPSNRVGLNDEILEKRPIQVASLPPLLPSLAQAQSQLLASTRSSAVIVRHNPAQNTTQVFALTEGVRVSGSQGGGTVELRGGETVAVANGVVGPIQTFNLARFYQTTGLANGLGPGQEDAIALEPVEIQKTIRLILGETLAAVEDQRGIFGRGSGTPIDQPRPPVVSPPSEAPVLEGAPPTYPNYNVPSTTITPPNRYGN